MSMCIHISLRNKILKHQMFIFNNTITVILIINNSSIINVTCKYFLQAFLSLISK